MSTTSDFELSRKYFFYHKDGLLDFFIGLGVLLAGAAMWAEMFWMAGSWIAIFLPLWISGRKQITYRRANDLQLSAGANPRFGLAISGLIGLLVLGVLSSIAFLFGIDNMPTFRSFLDTYIHLMVGTGIALLLAFSAIVMRLPRFYAYAVLTLAVFAAGHLFAWPFWYGMMLAGGLIGLAGIVILMRFLQTHPLAE